MTIEELWTIHKSDPRLPFNIEDASRRCENQQEEDVHEETEDKNVKGKKKDIIVSQHTRLDHRIIDLRVPANKAMMKVQAAVSHLFREFCMGQGWTEIHTPKIIGGTSEGGAEVFRLKYFGKDACLAQSPQLYKQMCIAADFDGVYEVGPVFRAEDSNTPRHLCEFMGLDFEVPFKNHYFEVIDIIGEMFPFIFKELANRYNTELEIVCQQYPFEPFLMNEGEAIKIEFQKGCEMLDAAGFTQDPHADLSTENEKELGRLVREQYQTDFYILYNYPREARPFYSMLNPHDSNYTNSYDVFMRGEEIMSGAQRVHDTEKIAERATEFGIPLDTISSYIDSFKYGCPPHAGGGVGLERVTKLFLGIHNIRKCSLFPRDPHRLMP